MENSLPRPDVAARALPARRGPGEWLLTSWLKRVRKGRLVVDLPSGRVRAFGAAEPRLQARLAIHDARLARRVLLSGGLGLAESYIAGEWDSPDLAAFLTIGALNRQTISELLKGSWPSRALGRLRHARRANTRAGSRRNIAEHYDLGNAFYRLWLDETMSYSAGLFARKDEPLAETQRRKYRRLARQLDLRPGDRVLEIGCGWGGFAEVAAAEFGCRLVGLTLSREQADYARARMARAGLSEAVEIRLQDYRDVEGQFDKIVSIEMFEAVGEENWERYFEVLRRCLRPGGRAGLQVITIADERFERYRRTPDFIQRYVFPGGMLPSPGAFERAVAGAGLSLVDSLYFGKCYAETLRRWRAAFHDNWPAIRELGFDERFRRLWHYYLCYCEVGFDLGHIDVGQFVIERP